MGVVEAYAGRWEDCIHGLLSRLKGLDEERVLVFPIDKYAVCPVFLY